MPHLTEDRQSVFNVFYYVYLLHTIHSNYFSLTFYIYYTIGLLNLQNLSIIFLYILKFDLLYMLWPGTNYSIYYTSMLALVRGMATDKSDGLHSLRRNITTYIT